jgi:high-affinity Fe2+/Pb2+ permease
MSHRHTCIAGIVGALTGAACSLLLAYMAVALLAGS